MYKAKAVLAIDRRDWHVCDCFRDVFEAAAYFDMCYSTVRAQCRGKSFMRGEYIVLRYADDCKPEDEREPLKGEPVPVHVERGGESWDFPDVPTAARCLDIAPRMMRDALHGQRPFLDGYTIGRQEVVR